jgi:serine/threonine protein kinase
VSTNADPKMTTLELGHEQQAVQSDRRLVAGRYRLHGQIGSGRLGHIYEAEDEGYRELGVGRRVAIQLLPDRIALDQGLFSKLKLGFTVLRAGSHPNIVSYSDCDHDGKFGYLVMELLDGASLRFVLDDVTTLPLDEALPVIRAIGDALQFLHAKSMVHGQLTAESVFITDDLDVHLLDVVPLDSASTILRGVASRDPFNRSDASDDIYALACLAYEILAGKHPFNFHPPAEASLAGIKPARIRSLPEKQWSAISRALSFDRDERPATVRDFLADLGVTGTERLRPSESKSADHAATQKPARNDRPRTRQPDTPASISPAPVPAAPAVVTAPAPRDEKRRKMARARRNRASRIRSFFLAIVLAGLVAWYFYGQPRDDIADLPALVDAYLDPAPAESGGVEPLVALTQDTSAPAEPAVTADELNPPVETDAPAATVAADETFPQSNAEPLAEPVPDTATPEPAAAVESAAAVEAETAADTPGSTLIQSFVTVYERDGAARIAFRQPVGTTGALFWWTGDHTAVADTDYIALDPPVIAFALGEEAETLHVPLVNDSLPEPRETFYVFLGQRNVESGRLEPIARIRVDVNDDD